MLDRPDNDTPGEHVHRRRVTAGVTSPPPPSALLFRWFSAYARRYLRRHFHAVRIAGGAPSVNHTDPVVVYLNHPSWWDPLTCLILATQFFPARRHYAPIDARALGRYQFFRRLGFFGVEPGTQRGAAQFLRVGSAVLARADAMLWVTAEGAFRDPRGRPVRLQPGLARLLARAAAETTVLPLAIEYPFWQERTPELLVRFGEPLCVRPGDALPADDLQHELERRLEHAMDELRAAAVRQDPAAFETLHGGRAGVGGVYDLWRRAAAMLRGRRFVAEHGGTGG